MYLLLSFAVLLLVAAIGSCSLPLRLWNRLIESSDTRSAVFTALGVIAVMVISVAFLVNSSYNPFLYFRF